MAWDYGDKPNTVPWPPLVYTGAVAAAWLLQRFDAWTWGDRMLAHVPWQAGAALIAVGFGLDLWSFVTLRRARTTVLPHAGARRLVTGGPYRFSRNPIYLGNTVALAGMALAMRWSWLLMLVPVTASAVSWLAIAREEKHLARRFGPDWNAYAARVRRWL